MHSPKQINDAGGIQIMQENGIPLYVDASNPDLYAQILNGDFGAITPYSAPDPAPATADDVAAERSRRLALGFDYDFGDARGVHHFATTQADMKGWDEVTMLANALAAAGLPAQTIDIVTETGAATITAAEWPLILIAAGQARQPVWAASFALQSIDPIPADYADDAYWP